MALNGIFRGTEGTISLAVEGSPVQQGDFNAINTAYGGSIFSPIGRVEDVQVCVQTELQEYYELGARDPVQIVPGNVHISGKVGRAYVNGSLIFLLLGRGAKGTDLTTVQPRFALNLLLKRPDNPTDELHVNVLGVKFENWALHVPQNTFVMEQLTFKAASMGIIDKDDGTDINVAFPES